MLGRALILVLGLLALARGARVSLQHVNAADERGWLRVKIDFSGGHQGFNVRIAHVDWCSALSAHSDPPRIDPESGACVGNNVMHKRIYTWSSGIAKSARNIMVYRPEDGSVFVNPASFGGVDPTREAYIVVHATFVRAYGAEEAGQGTNRVVSALRMDTPPSRYQAPDPDVGWDREATVAMKTEPPPSIGSSVAAKQPWYVVMAGVMGCMVCFVVVVGALLVNRADRATERGWAGWSRSLGFSSHTKELKDEDEEMRAYGPSQYLFSSSSSFAVPVDVKERNRAQQVSLLMQLGEGANPAFEQNL